MINSLRLQNFRGFADAQFEFEPGVNIIVGPNASGKTTILEALLIIAGQGTFKGQDTDLVRFSKDWLRVDAVLEASSRAVKLTKDGEDRTQKSYVIDGVDRQRLGTTYTLPVVLFEPQDMNMLSGDPAGRRDFLDRILSATAPGYTTLAKNYRRALSQRNRLLKQLAARPSSDTKELFVWDLRLSELGGAVHAARKALVDRMAATFADEYDRISGKQEPAAITYESSVSAADYTTSLLKKLANSYEKDVARGFTGVGPHRDDLVISLRDHDARLGASRGETRSLLLALKLLEVLEVERAAGTKPMLLLDDVFSELDGHRRRSLAGTIKDYQTFITTTDADIIVKEFAQKLNVIAM
jgi:DNA replication and repair protein RecF